MRFELIFGYIVHS